MRKIGYEAKMWTMEGWNEWIFMRERWVVFAFGFCFNAKRISYLSRCARFYIRTRFALLPLSRAAASTRVKCSAIWCKRLVAVYIILIVINWRRLAVARSWNIYIKLLTLCVFLNFRLRVLFFFFFFFNERSEFKCECLGVYMQCSGPSLSWSNKLATNYATCPVKKGFVVQKIELWRCWLKS